MVAPAPAARKVSFILGNLAATPGVLDALQKSCQSAMSFIVRHARGDWGDVGPEDWKANDEAVAHEGDLDRQGRLLSSYMTSRGDKVWIISEWDRSVTTILLPSEY